MRPYFERFSPYFSYYRLVLFLSLHSHIQWQILVLESEVTQSCLTLCNPMKPARLLHPWDSPGKLTGVGAISFSRGASRTRDGTRASCFAGKLFIILDTGESLVLEITANAHCESLALSRSSACLWANHYDQGDTKYWLT